MITKQLIGFLLMFLLGAIYYFYVQKLIKVSDLTEVRGALEEPIFFGTHGGDFRYEYARIRIKNFPTKIIVQNCAYSNLNFQALKRLEVGDSLSILAIEDFPENEFDAYDIRSSPYGTLLQLEAVNRCRSGTWKKALYLAGAMALALLVKLALIPLWKRLR